MVDNQSRRMGAEKYTTHIILAIKCFSLSEAFQLIDLFDARIDGDYEFRPRKQEES
jgi:hypothetical protein